MGFSTKNDKGDKPRTLSSKSAVNSMVDDDEDADGVRTYTVKEDVYESSDLIPGKGGTQGTRLRFHKGQVLSQREYAAFVDAAENDTDPILAPVYATKDDVVANATVGAESDRLRVRTGIEADEIPSGPAAG